MRVLASLLLATALARPDSVHAVSGAGFDFHFAPPHPIAGEPVSVVATFTDALYVEPFVTISRSGSTVRIVMLFSDFVPDAPQVRTWSLGTFEPGTYRVEYYADAALKPPGSTDPPALFAVDDLHVAAPALAVPAIDGGAIAVACAALGLAGLARMRRRHRVLRG